MQNVYLPIQVSGTAKLSLMALIVGGLPVASAQTTPFPLGAYIGTADNAQYQTNYDNFTQLMGASPQFYVYNIDVTMSIPEWPGNASYAASSQRGSIAANATPVIGFPMHSSTSSLSNDQDYQAFAGGQYDEYIQQVVQAYQSNGYTTQYYRIGWEMNDLSYGTYAPSSYAGTDTATQADWTKAFQHIATVLRKAGSTYGVTIKTIYNPNVINYDQTNSLSTLYPGDGYVDIVGADMYADMNPYQCPSYGSNMFYDWHKGSCTDTLTEFIADPVNRIHYWNYPSANNGALDPNDPHDVSLQSILKFAKAKGKPFAMGETGAGNSNSGNDVSDEASFPAWLAHKLQVSGDTIAFVDVWDSNGGGNYEFSNTSDNKPKEASAWAQNFGTK